MTPGQRVLKYFLLWFRTCFKVDPWQGSECLGGSPWVAEPRPQCSLSEAQACQGPPRQERHPNPSPAPTFLVCLFPPTHPLLMAKVLTG